MFLRACRCGHILSLTCYALNCSKKNMSHSTENYVRTCMPLQQATCSVLGVGYDMICHSQTHRRFLNFMIFSQLHACRWSVGEELARASCCMAWPTTNSSRGTAMPLLPYGPRPSVGWHSRRRRRLNYAAGCIESRRPGPIDSAFGLIDCFVVVAWKVCFSAKATSTWRSSSLGKRLFLHPNCLPKLVVYGDNEAPSPSHAYLYGFFCFTISAVLCSALFCSVFWSLCKLNAID